MFCSAELLRHATFYLPEQFRHALFYLAELLRQVAFPFLLFQPPTHPLDAYPKSTELRRCNISLQGRIAKFLNEL